MNSRLLESLVGRFQRFAGELTDVEGPEDIAAALARLGRDTPVPQNHLEYIAISNLLMRTFVGVSMRLHAPSGLNRCSCNQVTVHAMMMLLQPAPADPHQVLRQWTDEFLQVFERNHLASPAARAAQLIRGSPARAWDIAELAAMVRANPRQLRRQFAIEHGVSIRDYLHLVRMKRAFPAIVDGTDKIEAIALEFGYRSKKDFYRMVWVWLKATPAQLRRLPAAEQSRLRDALLRIYASTRRHRFATSGHAARANAATRSFRPRFT